MVDLSPEQNACIQHSGNVFVTACPGSGKTRVLTEKVVAALNEIESPKHRIAALTFTRRAAEEISSRLGADEKKQVWTGTIHSFALEWILRPYSSYVKPLRCGFTVLDEYSERSAINELRTEFDLRPFDQIDLRITREGTLVESDPNSVKLIRKHRRLLRERKLIDFHQVLYYAFGLLGKRPEIAKTLSAIFKLICVDEYQDTQDLQYGILSKLLSQTNSVRLFMVGDVDQAIYTSLGSVAKSSGEVKSEFSLDALKRFRLEGNYRSTQRIIDYCSRFQSDNAKIQSKAKYASELGIITFSNLSVDKDRLPKIISNLVKFHMANGVKEEDICILAPTWQFVSSFGRNLVDLLPDVSLDAPGLSPLKRQYDSVWFKLARIFLTDPEPRRFTTRMRWAADFIRNFELELGKELSESTRQPRNLLRCTNAIQSTETEGLAYLNDVFEQFLVAIEFHFANYPTLLASFDSFFESAQNRLDQPDYGFPSDLENLKRTFRHPSGLVIETCHGIKGEEFEVVICFGALQGRIPNWQRIIPNHIDDAEEARRLLYVVASRAKKHLHIFSEDGRSTNSGSPYYASTELARVKFDYDELPT